MEERVAVLEQQEASTWRRRMIAWQVVGRSRTSDVEIKLLDGVEKVIAHGLGRRARVSPISCATVESSQERRRA